MIVEIALVYCLGHLAAQAFDHNTLFETVKRAWSRVHRA